MGEAARLVWRSARPVVCGYLLVTVVEAAAPVALAWLTKLVIDSLTASGPVFRFAGMLAGGGVLAAALPRLSMFLRNETARRISSTALDQLFAATGRFVGL